MNKNALIKVSLFSITIAVVLSLISLLFMNRIMSIQGARFRDEFLRFYASSIEQKLQKVPADQVSQHKDLLRMDRDFRPPMMGPPPPPLAGMMPPPPPPRDGRPPHPPFKGPGGPGPDHRGPRPPHMDMDSWIVNGQGQVLIHKHSPALAQAWEDLPHPTSSKEFVTTENFFRIGNPTIVIRLNTETELYLIIKEPPRPMLGNLIITQAILTSAMIVIALILAIASLFFYMRRKSLEARSVLHRLEEGDLKARFEIHRLDEFGGLMLDFNRMAEEIEKLVGRIHATERTRKQLLQEMGHDLRTPLTSLKTSFETLQIHHDKLSAEKRGELFDVLIREIDYFKDLIEQLMTIASLDEPHFKASTERIDVMNLLTQEVRHRQHSDSKIKWSLEGGTVPPVLGDSHLIQRLIRNGLENAERYAESTVDVRIHDGSDSLTIEISDNGQGLDAEALKTFGQRREFRGRKITKNGHFSLGLGSVIMKAITDLHNGTLTIENRLSGNEIQGATLKITLPTSK
ncbi:Adaptive-response sensory-kinase SasA [Bdellovibrio bacteriovorus]|uniref:sensor histidine kinase n=1 Tax=Bdellovibrio bacteriovorus TaxID=959 RepID=UPI00045BFA50|nr:HAMP domain-containing sensor histidine kinase [Bdellovibrio bacteriovorus]AHZ84362.1 sensor protein kdpD [Bdellovibrio bacteriovorus]BEV68250.1 Adaptive-response sensory-kinase SasA [Bdellovibrio bacteriovorus]